MLKQLSIKLGLYRPARYLNDLRWGGLYSKRIAADVEFYRNILPQNSLVFDIGANIGDKSEALLTAGMRVVAVEPQPDCVAEIKARKFDPARCSLVPAAVGAEPGTLTLHLSDVHHAMASADPAWSRSTRSVTVPQTTLDKLIAQYGEPYYIKIDVEGYEREVLRGLSRQPQLLSFEFHKEEPNKAAECLAMLDGVANVTGPESTTFHFGEWVPVRDLTLPALGYGDIFVKRV